MTILFFGVRILGMKKVEAMARAVGHVDGILRDLMPGWLGEGVSEQEVYEKLRKAILNDGEYGLSFDPIVAFGEGAAEPHHEPSERKLRRGDPVLIDCGAIYAGWCSDCTRMFCLGEPSAEFREKYEKLRRAQENALRRFVNGAKCFDVDASVREELGEDAQYFIHTLGHGVGKEVHEDPRIGPKAKDEVLKVGDVVTCEPGLYYEGKFGIRIEDQLVISDEGQPQILTSLSRELIVID